MIESGRVGSGRVGSSRGSSPCMHAGRQADNKHATALAKEGFTRGEWMGAALRREGEQRTTTRSLIDLCGEAERRSRWHGVSAPYFDWSSLARNGCGSSSEELSDCSCSAREGRLDRGVTDSLRAAFVNHLSFAPFLSSTRRPACLPGSSRRRDVAHQFQEAYQRPVLKEVEQSLRRSDWQFALPVCLRCFVRQRLSKNCSVVPPATEAE